ncbi:MAG: class I SAM-dependent methyltransferase [Woeseiaceae bacterium]
MNKEAIFPATMMPDKDWWQALWPDPEAVLSAVGIKPDMQVVDLCCGDGHFTKPMCELVHPGKTWALDLDADLLGEAEQGCKDNPNFHAILGDARELSKQIDGVVDFIFIANTFHGAPEKTELSEAVYASLKKGGRFAVIN